ncbi:MAG: WbqC family protein [Granulosicoccus sp.]
MTLERTVAIAQPTYLPWLGYFDLMDQSDVFVFLDDVQFSRQSWQQRNRIRTDKGLEWLTLPVPKKGVSKTAIKDIPLGESMKFPHSHLASVEQHYSQCPYFEEYFAELRQLMQSKTDKTTHPRLASLTMSLIIWQSKQLGISSRILCSSEMNVAGTRTERLVRMCKAVKATTYLSPAGSVDYLVNEHREFDAAGLSLRFHHYEHPQYKQRYTPFQPYATTLDLLFNCGQLSMDIIRGGRRPSLTLGQLLEKNSGAADISLDYS